LATGVKKNGKKADSGKTGGVLSSSRKNTAAPITRKRKKRSLSHGKSLVGGREVGDLCTD